jgi:hypothetical protein
MDKWNELRPYKKGDVLKVWQSLRHEDALEFATLGVHDPLIVEDFITDGTQRLMTWDTEGGPVAVIGVTEGWAPDVGCIWAIASDAARPRWRFAVRNTDAILKELGQGYLVLSNFKSTHNTGQINWLRRLGFTFIRTDADYGGSGATFHQFVRIVE